MPAKQVVSVKRIKSKKTCISLLLEFPENDPRSEEVFTNLGRLLGAFLNDEERTEFVSRLGAAEAKLAGTSPKRVRE